jgi:xylose isomerase
MRYYTNPGFKLGAFTNPEESVRREAIDLTKRGIDAARAMGANLMTHVARPGRLRLCNFQLDYAQVWE